MHVVGSILRICLGIEEIKMNSSMGYVKLTQDKCFKPCFQKNIALRSLWVWVEVEGFKDCWVSILYL